MIFNRQPIFYCLFLLLVVVVFQSCGNRVLFVFNRTSVKNPLKDSTPFVFDNRIVIEPGVISKDEKNRLETELNTYWDDTIKARRVQQYGVFYRIKDPQRFDTIGLQRSILFMNSYLRSQGYYHASLRPQADTAVFTRNSKPATAFVGGVVGGATGTLLARKTPLKGGAIGTAVGAGIGLGVGAYLDRNATPQYRVTSTMYIHPGQRMRFDSVAYNLLDTGFATPADTILQQLTLRISDDRQRLLKKGDPYSKQVIANELDRLVTHFRQNGFYKLGREHFAALVDTTDQLIDSLIIDPFALARITAEAAERRRLNPTADITIMQTRQIKDVPADTAALKQYYVGRVIYYPETPPLAIIDSTLARDSFRIITRGNILMKYPGNEPMFLMRPLVRHTYINTGELYNERRFFRTINTLGQMGPWQQVDFRDSIRNDTIDFHIFLTPNRKKNIRAAFELTRSTGDFAASNNLFGIGGNITYLNRNFKRRAIQWGPYVRGGVELNLEARQKLLQTIQFGVGQNFVLPHLIFPFKLNERKYDAARTMINMDGSYTDRRDFFRLRSFVTSLGYEWRVGNESFLVRLPNIELYALDTLKGLIDAFEQNPFLRTAFNTGSVISAIFTYTQTHISPRNPRATHFRRGGIEWAGFGLPLLFPGLQDNLFHYVKAEAEYVIKWQQPKSATVVRGFLGIGVNLINDDQLGKSLPFFKQFIAGGPNSMRAWPLRQLGLGSSTLSENNRGFRDRFGDMQFEANVEYRFDLANAGGAKFSSALFTDIGNLWNVKSDPNNPRGTFRFNRFYDDLAVAVGVGLLRVNVANFLFRVDFAIKAKDPVRRENNGWLDLNRFTWKNEYGNNNYAFQIGIGLPF